VKSDRIDNSTSEAPVRGLGVAELHDRSSANKANVYIIATVILGLVAVISVIPQWPPHHITRFLAFFLISALGSSMKVKLPGLKGTVSVGFFFCLIGVMELSRPEVTVIAIAAIVIQCLWRVKKRPRLIQVLFNVSSMCLAVMVTYVAYHSEALRSAGLGPASLLAVAACTQFTCNTFPVAWVIALSERKSLRKILRECYFWSFPYYVVGAVLAGGFLALDHRLGWQVAILCLPVVYIIYSSYRSYLGRLEDEKNHAAQVDSLHMRTIQALALAIEAKDATKRDHNRCVQMFAVEIGKEMGLSEAELKGLGAAAVLHDIGKLAIPENIISKPGRLTPEEFEKMKIHPVIGAEILEQVEFPYPVAPIVRAHHEKWDGTGYPLGLKGEEIPLAARILGAIDCLDALASDRQYRRALTLDEAMAQVAREANQSFDPKVVAILQRRYRELETVANSVAITPRKLPPDVPVQAGIEPVSGLETSTRDANEMEFLGSIAAATQEAQALFELSQTLGNSLSLNETLSVFAIRLNRIVPHDAIAIYLASNGRLSPEYVNGKDSELFSSLQIPVGQGLSGWVMDNRKSILNGDPSVEAAYLNDPATSSKLRAALSVPLEGVDQVIGVLTLYHAQEDAFSKDHLRVLLALSSKVGLSIENAVRYQKAECSATTDYLTELPNARSLFLQLHGEISRGRRNDGELTVLVCDLDGFKQVNDRFGHLEGNRLLKLVARGLRKACRDYDYVARMGGDEFVLILPELHSELVPGKMEQINQIVREIGQQLYGEDILGVSIGEASYPDDGVDAESLLAEADRRMYKTKQRRKAEQATQAPAQSDQATDNQATCEDTQTPLLVN
jgi:diguanylate cyclase (GGDEF)-like protein/putative nucleotidyltransferase with HDIG domain